MIYVLGLLKTGRKKTTFSFFVMPQLSPRNYRNDHFRLVNVNWVMISVGWQPPRV